MPEQARTEDFLRERQVALPGKGGGSAMNASAFPPASRSRAAAFSSSLLGSSPCPSGCQYPVRWVLYAVQQPLSRGAFDDVIGVPAWKAFPSWYLVAQDDEALPPDAERMFANRMNATTIEVPSGHFAMVSHPAEVVSLTETAAEAALAAGAFH
jgi:pimeloyl-ACP methyl ester carboxylesterase